MIWSRSLSRCQAMTVEMAASKSSYSRHTVDMQSASNRCSQHVAGACLACSRQHACSLFAMVGGGGHQPDGVQQAHSQHAVGRWRTVCMHAGCMHKCPCIWHAIGVSQSARSRHAVSMQPTDNRHIIGFRHKTGRGRQCADSVPTAFRHCADSVS